MPDKPSVIELKMVSKSFAGPESGAKVDILKDVTLSILSGESVAVTGPSGSGKSTLLNLMAGLDKPTCGSVFVKNRELAGMSDDALAAMRNVEIGFVFQMHHLLPQCTVLENVLIPTLATTAGTDGAEDRALRLLNRVGLADRVRHKPGNLSGGECQRVAVVRALINKPAIILADEPTGSLDQSSAEHLARLLVDMNTEEQTTLVIVTHSPQLAQLLTRKFVLKDGGILS